MECVDGDCNCGVDCQNQRFQRKQYASVSVIRTEKKGYGLRANADLSPNDFIFEYIGEVINEQTFRKRTIAYDEEGIKHFYFMSLTKSEFVDATKKGNLGRFCNHSCNPNCYVDKWVVGDKLRMGIFAERHIKAGEELVFNYNVDRYGADPQPCYCGELNCTGYIGGKTQTERATKLSHATIEALGIDDGDGWDSAVAKKPRKKKIGEDDEEYVNNVQPRGLDEDGVRKVMASLMQCKEKWIAVKLLSRIQRCDDDRVRNRVVQMHGYQILKSALLSWPEDDNVTLQIFDILYKFPRLTRNKIIDSKIEDTISTFVDSEHEDVSFEAKRLLEEWSKLEVAYRIPRKKFDPNAVPIFERRNTDRVEEVTKSPPTLNAPTGPRNNIPQRNANFIPSRLPVRRPFNSLPPGWFTAMDDKGNPYYYSKAGQTTWQRPFLPAAEPPPPPKIPPKSVQQSRALQDIIDSITKPDPSASTPSRTAPPTDSTPKEKKNPAEKWRSLSQEKQMKLYENTVSSFPPSAFPSLVPTNITQLFPHIKHVMQKFTKQLPKDDLKKFAKEVGKKLVASDFKNNRVEDPMKISEKQEKKVKKYVREYFEKAVEKKKVLERRKREKEQAVASSTSNDNGNGNGDGVNGEVDEMDLTPNSPSPPSPEPDTQSQSATPSPDLSRKRPRDVDPDTPSSESNKRIKEESEDVDATPPPPPPPPPADPESGFDDLDTGASFADSSFDGNSNEGLGLGLGIGVVEREETEEQKELRRQEEELMRENEEAMKEEVGVEGLDDGSEVLISRGVDPAMKEVNGNGRGVKVEEGESKEGMKMEMEMEGVEMGGEEAGRERERERGEVGRS